MRKTSYPICEGLRISQRFFVCAKEKFFNQRILSYG
jgi:hypothetical protein